MRLNREGLIQILQTVQGGLATGRENLEQSTCFVFKGGIVMTFNDEVACRSKCPLEIEGAVKAKTFLEALQRYPEDELDMEMQGGQLICRGSGRRSAHNMEAEVGLPIEAVEPPGKWVPVPEGFAEAVQIVSSCSATDNNAAFKLKCVHIHPDHVEACDNWQMTRYPMKTGLEKDCLVKRDAIRHIVGLDMVEYNQTRAWLHFRNPAGLVLSCRKYPDEFPNLTEILAVDGEPATLPGGLAEAVDRASVFSAGNAEKDMLKIDLRRDKMRISGEGGDGKYEEQKTISYNGPPITFLIAPKILTELAKKHNECQITETRLKVDTGKFVYLTCLGSVEAGAK